MDKLIVRADQITELHLGNDPWIKVMLPTDADYEAAVKVMAAREPAVELNIDEA